MNKAMLATLAILFAAALVPATTAQPGFPTIAGLTLTSDVPGLDLKPGESQQLRIHAGYSGNATLIANVTTIAFAGTGFGGNGGFRAPPSGAPSGPPPSRPPGNFSRPPGSGGFPGAPANVEGMTLQASPASLKLAPGQSQDITISITSTKALEAGDYQAIVMIDAGANGRAMQSVTIHVAGAESQGAPALPLVGALAAFGAAALVTRRRE